MPFELMIAAVVAGTAVQAFSAIEAGKQQQANLEANARTQQEQARQVERAAQDEASRLARDSARLRATQRVGFAKSGVGIAGTPLLVFEEAADIVAADVAKTLQGGQRRATSLRTGARLSIAQGRSARRAGLFEAGTSLLRGGGTIAGQFA